MRALTRCSRLLLLICVTAALAAPADAVAQSNPFGPLPPAQPAQTTTAAPTTTGSASGQGGGLKRWQEILIFMAGVGLIAGIGFAIVGDARRSAPVTEEELAGAHRSSGAAARKPHDKAKARKKAKAARHARKQNR